MMYHSRQFLKSVALTQKSNGVRQVAKAAQRVMLVSSNQMGMFMVNQKNENLYNKFQMVQTRQFSSLPAHQKLEMPNLSPTMEKGNIAKWLKKEGDSIKPGDILAQIETDKATVDFEMQEEGYIAKLLFPEGAKDVKLGQVVAIIVDNKDDIAKFKDFKGDSAAAATQAPAAAPKK